MKNAPLQPNTEVNNLEVQRNNLAASMSTNIAIYKGRH